MANPPAPPRKSRLTAKPPQIDQAPGNLVRDKEDMVDMNMKVSGRIHQQVKMAAAYRRIQMKELILEAFELYKKHHKLDFLDNI